MHCTSDRRMSAQTASTDTTDTTDRHVKTHVDTVNAVAAAADHELSSAGVVLVENNNVPEIR